MQYSTHFWSVHKKLAEVHNDTNALKCAFNPDPIRDQQWKYMDLC